MVPVEMHFSVHRYFVFLCLHPADNSLFTLFNPNSSVGFVEFEELMTNTWLYICLLKE